MNQENFIFCDAQGKRWRRWRLLFAAGLVIVFTGVVLFIQSLIVCPRLSPVQQAYAVARSFKAAREKADKLYQPKLPPDWMKSGANRAAVAPERLLHIGTKQVRLGFYSGWDPESFTALSRNAAKLTHVAPEWFFVSGTPAELGAKPDQQVRAFTSQHDLALMPLLTNLNDTWQPEAVETLASADAERQKQFCTHLADQLKELQAAGVLVDWEEVDPTYRDAISRLFSTMAAVLHGQGLEVWLCVPVGNDIKVYDLDTLANSVDRFVAMLYDENGEGDEAGPIASQEWFAEWLSVLIEHGSPGQWIVGIGAYGYDWQAGQPAKTISFTDCMARASRAGEGPIEIQAASYGPHFAYTEKDQTHEVWFLDAVTFYNQKVQAESKAVGGIALYRLGTEDPAVWKILDCNRSCLPGSIETIKSTNTIAHIGEGDFVTATNERADGTRTITVDAAGLWNARYIRYPQYPLLYHQGQSSQGEVSLTFDDGPDPEWTPCILDILKEKDVKAAFFVVGSNAERYPDLIRRIIADGHELGSHTYTHADISAMPPAIVKLELNAAERIIECLTGRSTILFRPPYNADRYPHTPGELKPLLIANELGYITVSESIDSEDWDESAPSVLLERIRERRGEGNVVLLHDAGGDRSATVAALPLIIDYLRRRGDDIVPLHQLVGASRDAFMPAIPANDPGGELLIADVGFHLLHLLERFGWAFMIATTAFLLIRTVALLALAIRNRIQQHGKADVHPDMTEPVSVLIAAHNEATVIEATLASVLATNYRGSIEVVVVDDGSDDATAAHIARVVQHDPRVKLIRQSQKGKAAALNAALRAAAHDLIVMLDADTQFRPETIGRLLFPLRDKVVGAVSGHARVGNRTSWITLFQSLEYTCGFNLDRRAYDQWNCVTVVPGAISAFRKSIIMKAGGLSEDTMAEDTDLTLMIHRLGYKVAYAPTAVAFTEAPDTVAGLVRQRTRWAFGTLQCLIKHNDLLFNPRYKGLAFFSLPCIWFFHFFLVALIPAVDSLLIFSLLNGAGSAILDYALAFMVMDLAIALAACIMEGERLRWAWLILPMRLLYRPVLAWSVWKAIIRALRGAWVAWGRQDRKGLVPAGPRVPGEKPISVYVVDGIAGG